MSQTTLILISDAGVQVNPNNNPVEVPDPNSPQPVEPPSINPADQLFDQIAALCDLALLIIHELRMTDTLNPREYFERSKAFRAVKEAAKSRNIDPIIWWIKVLEPLENRENDPFIYSDKKSPEAISKREKFVENVLTNKNEIAPIIENEEMSLANYPARIRSLINKLRPPLV